MKKIKKAIIPAAGFGTRMLPASKAVPKEMYPIVDKPVIQYIVEEAAASGIESILIITSRMKNAIEDHFDLSPELENELLLKGKEKIFDDLKNIPNIDIHFLRQKEVKGLGHAILCARSFVGEETFAVLYPDDMIISKTPACAQLIRAYEKFDLSVVGVKAVGYDEITKYSSVKIKEIEKDIFECTDMIEKPSEREVFSNYAIIGRCVLTAEIFPILERTKPGAGGEIQLTDAMKVLAQRTKIIAINYEGKRFDTGNKLGAMLASFEVAMSHKEIGNEFEKKVKEYFKVCT